MDTSSHYCPDEQCGYYGWVGPGNIRANGHPNGGRWRQLACTECGKYFMETLNTIFYRKQTDAETIWQVLAALAGGLDIRGTARVFRLDPNTVERWLRQGAEHMRAVSRYLIHELHLTQVGVRTVINTAFIERLNLTIRQHVPAPGRKVSSLAKATTGLLDQFDLVRTYCNFCLPHTAGARRSARRTGLYMYLARFLG